MNCRENCEIHDIYNPKTHIECQSIKICLIEAGQRPKRKDKLQTLLACFVFTHIPNTKTLKLQH